jgi:iron complex outermembrane recepter protein
MNRIDVRRPGFRLTSGTIRIMLGTLLLASAATGAAAQNQEGASPDSVPQYNLSAITVNILRSPIVLSNAAYPVDVVGQRELQQGKTGMFLEEALRSLPGVQVQNRFNYAVGERVSIHGFGSRAQFGVRGIRVIVDGIPATLPDGQSTLDHVDIGSLGRVEALSGPAAALYGNASGGVLRFSTEIPSTAPVREQATVVGGTDGLLRMQSTTGGTVGTTGYVVSLDRLRYDGFRKTQAGDPYGKARRLQLNARMTQAVAGGQLGITVNSLDLNAENPGSLPLAAFQSNPHQVWPTYTIFQTRKDVSQTQLGVSWTGGVGGLDTEAAVYGISRFFLNPLPSDVADVGRRAGGARLTLGRTIQGDVPVDIRGGFEFDLMHDNRREYSSNGGKEDQLQLNQVEMVKSAGLFLTTTVTPVQRLDLVGGLRYDGFRFQVLDNFPVSPTNPDDSGKRVMNSFSPTVGIHVAATQDIGVYANYATSFETPTTVELGNRENGSGGFNPNLDPQTGKTFEGGVRGAMNNRVSFEASAFHTRLKNELIPFENSDGLTYYRNAGSSTRKGVDLTLRAQPLDLLSGQISYTRTDARFNTYVLKGQDLSGKKVPGLAPNQVDASLRVGPSQWFLEGNVEYMDKVPVDDPNAAPFAASYTIFGLRLGASAVDLGGFQISPFAGVNNLGDKTYVSSVTVNAFGGRYYEPGPGREFYIGGSVAVSR